MRASDDALRYGADQQALDGADRVLCADQEQIGVYAVRETDDFVDGFTGREMGVHFRRALTAYHAHVVAA